MAPEPVDKSWPVKGWPGPQSLGGLAFVLAVLATIVIVVVAAVCWWFVVEASPGMLRGLLALLTIFLVIAFFAGGWGLLVALCIYLIDPIERLLELARGGPPWYRNPTDPSYYPETFRGAAREVIARVFEALQAEAEQLRRPGIPVPERASYVSFQMNANESKASRGEYVLSRLDVEFPRFELPPAIFFCLFEPDPHDPKRGAGYFVAGESNLVDAVLGDLRTIGPWAVVEKYDGIWLSRNPFEYHARLHGQRFSFEDAAGFLNWTQRHLSGLLAPRNLPPLERVKGYTPAEVAEITWRLSFFAKLVRDTGLPLEGVPPVPSWLANTVSLGLPIPKSTLGEQIVTLKVLPGTSVRATACQQFLDSLRTLRRGFAFEIASEDTSIFLRFCVAAEDQEFLENQLSAFFPGFSIVPDERENALRKPLQVVELCPAKVYRRIKPLRSFSVDPYAALLGLLDKETSSGFQCVQVTAFPIRDEAIQIIAQETDRLTDDGLLLHLQKLWGWESYSRSHELVPRAWELQQGLHRRTRELQEKLPAWFVSLRFYTADNSLAVRAKKQWLAQYETPEQKLESSEARQATQLVRSIGSNWTVLNTEELAALVHFPGPEVQCERLERTTAKMKAPPSLMTTDGAKLGVCHHHGLQIAIALPDNVRDRHVYLIGKTRTGKSTLMLNLAVQDILAGKGVGVIDPHGDLVEDLLRYIPKERVQDTIYFDAANRRNPLSLNIMEIHSDEELGVVADDLVVTFRRLSENWGERMESLLRYSFYTLLYVDGTTLFDLERLLLDQVFREKLLAQIDFPAVVSFWRNQYPRFPKDSVQPILSRMSKFVLSPSLSAILGQRRSRLNFFDLIQNKKILLVNLAQGKIGEDSAKLLGSLIVSQIQLAAMRRAVVRREAREPFYLYVDEFQNFTTSAFDKILSEAGKYKLCLTLAHQYISQLEERLRNAILGNVGTTVMFTSWPQDASYLRAELGAFSVEDLASLSAMEHEALCRPPTGARDTFRFKTLPPPGVPAESSVQEIIAHSKANYSVPAQPVARTEPAPEPRSPEVRAAAGAQGQAVPPGMLLQSTSVEASHATAPQAEAARQVARPMPPPPVQKPPVSREGRGGDQHKYLQHLIKRWGESKGYRTTIEKRILDGMGSVDVALEKGEISVACEICVTTSVEHELQNVQKCLAAGFSCVVLVSSDRKTLGRASDLVASSVTSGDADRVRFLSPEELFSFLVELEAEAAGKEETVKGYKVKVEYKAVSEAEQKARQQAIAATVVRAALRRLRRPE